MTPERIVNDLFELWRSPQKRHGRLSAESIRDVMRALPRDEPLATIAAAMVQPHLSDADVVAKWQKLMLLLCELRKPKPQVVEQLAKEPQVVESVLKAIPDLYGLYCIPGVSMLLAMNGSDAAVAALSARVAAVDRYSNELVAVAKLRKLLKAPSPGVEALLASVDSELAAQRAATKAHIAAGPAMRLAHSLGLGKLAKFKATYEHYWMNMRGHRLSISITIDGQQVGETWFTFVASHTHASETSLAESFSKRTAFYDGRLERDDLDLGVCTPTELASWLPGAYAKLGGVIWQHNPHRLTTSVRLPALERVERFFMPDSSNPPYASLLQTP